MKILVVDDEYMFGSLLSRALTRLGHECSVVAHPIDALEMVTGDDFDAVITDIDMPDMNGVELASKLRHEHDLPVAFCTGSDPGTKVIEDAKQFGDVLPKVWTVAQVKSVVAKLSLECEDRRQRLARGSAVVIPTHTEHTPAMMRRHRAKTNPGRPARRRIKVQCKTWDEVQKLIDDRARGEVTLTIRGNHPFEADEDIVIALQLPNDMILSIAARIGAIRDEGTHRVYPIDMIGLTADMCERLGVMNETTQEDLKN